jgi:hypothetical protein
MQITVWHFSATLRLIEKKINSQSEFGYKMRTNRSDFERKKHSISAENVDEVLGVSTDEREIEFGNLLITAWTFIALLKFITFIHNRHQLEAKSLKTVTL